MLHFLMVFFKYECHFVIVLCLKMHFLNFWNLKKVYPQGHASSNRPHLLILPQKFLLLEISETHWDYGGHSHSNKHNSQQLICKNIIISGALPWKKKKTSLLFILLEKYPSIFWLKFLLKFTDDKLYKYPQGNLDKFLTSISKEQDSSWCDNSGNRTEF